MSINIVVPSLGESVVEATVGRWRKKEGESVRAGETLVELETDKVNLEVGAERDGVLARIEHKEGDDVKIGDVLGILEEVGAAITPTAEPKEPKREPIVVETKPPTPQPSPPSPLPSWERGEGERAQRDKATPVAKRLAEEHGIDLAQVKAGGADGRVTKEDVQRYIEQQQATVPSPVSEVQPPSSTLQRPEQRIKMSRRRRTIAQRLVEAQHTAAMLTTFNEVDMSAVIDIRNRRKESFKEKHGVGLGFMSFFVKAAIGALKAFPQLNAEIRGDEIVLKHYYDIGMAVGAEEGLVVPVLRDADRMSFAEIERTIEGFVQKVKDNTLSVEDLRGGTFTITNGGVFGSLLSTPILNPPQVGILGLHKIEQRPIVVNGEVVVRPMMYVALSYDHRIVDGREAVQFLVRVKQLIEEPETLLLEG